MSDDLVDVHLLGFPLDLWQRASAHQEAIQREMAILRTNDDSDSLPNRLLDLMEVHDAQYAETSGPTWDEVRAAAARGEETVDVTFTVPRSAAGAATRLGDMLAEVDEFCRAGEHLITLATPPEMVALRHWVLGEFVRQIEQGGQPLSWEEFREMNGEAKEPPNGTRAGVGSVTIVFEGSLDLSTVGGLRDEIQEARARSPEEIIVDLTRVGFLDSIGIGMLVTAHNRLEEEGVHLRLVVPTRIRELLRISGLTNVLKPEEPADA